MTEQTVIGGFTITFDGVTTVSGGYQWSYTIVNDGTEKDLSNWVLALKNCPDDPESLACSLGICERVTQNCSDSTEGCESFAGIKFDNLASDQLKQTFTFILPYQASPTDGCFYLKYGLNRVCGTICVPTCDPTDCPPCPIDSLRTGRIFTVQVELPVSACGIDFSGETPNFYSCIDKLIVERSQCQQPIEWTMCADTESEQVVTCLVELEYIQWSGELQIIWQLQALLDTVCEEKAVSLSFVQVTSVAVDELCYFCSGESPNITPSEICDWFDVEFISLSEDGVLTYKVTFSGCDSE
jgi:hypothetical protein